MLEVCIRRDRKERMRKQEHADTRGSVTPKAGRSAALAHLGAVVPLSLKHTKPLGKGDFSGHRKTKG